MLMQLFYVEFIFKSLTNRVTHLNSMTFAPLPSWRNLFLAFFNSVTSDDELIAPWCRSGDLGFLLSRSAWSLALLVHWRRKLGVNFDTTVWIPDFMCNASLGPLRETGAKLIFYPVTEEMEPNYGACQILAEQHSIDVFVLVHYFGQPNAAERIATFCKEHGAWLIEDATHVLQPISGIGEVGDCVLYSPHKHLPIPDGAILVVRPNGPACFCENNIAIPVFSKVKSTFFAMPGNSIRHTALWVLRRLAQKIGFRQRRVVTSFKQEVLPGSVTLHPSMSFLSRRLLLPLLPKLQLVAAQREEHAQIWRDVLVCATSEIAPIPNSRLVTPYLAGFSANNDAVAETVFARLQQADIPVTTWPDLAPEVQANADEHKAAIALRYSRFYLPVHQTIAASKLLASYKSLLDEAALHWKIKTLSRNEWDLNWSHCAQTNLLQSWQYGQAKNQAEGWGAKRFLVLDENKQPVAIMQILTRVLPFVGGIARLNRGPLLLDNKNHVSEASVKLRVMRVLQREARYQRWWMLQAAPELINSAPATLGLQALGFKKIALPAWASGLLTLHIDEQALLMNLNGKWRNCLRKGIKLGVTVTHQECKGEALESLIKSYTDLQSKHEFVGLSENLIRRLAEQLGPQWQFNLFVARNNVVTDDSHSVGLLVTVHSGDTAIYLIGSVNDKGRQMQANSVLLWQALIHAKNSGCDWFDIGGLSEVTPKGIAEFKQGLNAMPYKLVGEWRKWL
jgi:lipid II:glycine glycyltransferase (peptidoglycan interpeptide bridge formation enzyme)